MIYQHGTFEAGKAIADSLHARIEAALSTDGENQDNATGTLVPVA